MKALVRTGCAGRVAVLISAGTAACPAALTQSAGAQSAVEVRTIVSVPPQEEPARPPAGAPEPAAVPPWDMPPSSSPAQPSTLAAANTATGPSPSTSTGAFTGSATPLSCHPGSYRAIIDERTDLRFGTLCPLPDGTWQMLP